MIFRIKQRSADIVPVPAGRISARVSKKGKQKGSAQRELSEKGEHAIVQRGGKTIRVKAAEFQERIPDTR